MSILRYVLGYLPIYTKNGDISLEKIAEVFGVELTEEESQEEIMELLIKESTR